MKKTAVAAALTALAVPSAALADDGDRSDRGRGHDRSDQRRGDSQRQDKDRSNRARRGQQRVGFALSGTGLSGLSGTTLTLPLTLDLTRANKHARKALSTSTLTVNREFLQGTGTLPVGTAGDTFRLRLSGVTDTNTDGKVDLADVVATDRVKVIGKVTRTRTRSEDGSRSVSYGALDIKKIVISRPSADDDDNS